MICECPKCKEFVPDKVEALINEFMDRTFIAGKNLRYFDTSLREGAGIVSWLHDLVAEARKPTRSTDEIAVAFWKRKYPGESEKCQDYANVEAATWYALAHAWDK
jgi:hypothetical protein